MKGQFDNVISVIHASSNPYDIAFVSLVLLDLEARQSKMLFDFVVTANVALNQPANQNSSDSMKFVTVSSAPGDGSLHDQAASHPQAQQQTTSVPYQQANYGKRRGRGRGFGGNMT